MLTRFQLPHWLLTVEHELGEGTFEGDDHQRSVTVGSDAVVRSRALYPGSAPSGAFVGTRKCCEGSIVIGIA